ncbi:Abi family protein [Collinsella aerofaciens]|uniref:Abi family protein n=1 Tax=Collinsella aerofaciens TaxID=74426 RepID=UPI00319DBD2B
MARKPFKTLEEQVAILESRGLSMPEYAAYALLGEDYYCVVNGYKEPFLDKEASAEAGHDVYAEGTGFGDLYGLFLFDRDLRNLTFKYLLKAEARVRSVAAYTFSEAYRELDAYLKIANYTDAKDYMVGAEPLRRGPGRAHRPAHPRGLPQHLRPRRAALVRQGRAREGRGLLDNGGQAGSHPRLRDDQLLQVRARVPCRGLRRREPKAGRGALQL